MGYLHIDNLYRHPDFLKCYALEKIDGTSAHIRYSEDKVYFYSGGASHLTFIKLFDENDLLGRFRKFSTTLKDENPTIFVYGEAFGGKIQGMSATYGKELRFIVFDVKINNRWASVPYAESIAKELGLPFVPYEKGPITVEWLNEQRDRPSLVAVVENAMREGIVVRQVYENQHEDGGRNIYKHKRPEFRETRTHREVDDPEAMRVIEEANEIAREWVTPMRLKHVLQKTPYNKPEDTPVVIRAMIEDVKRESSGETVWCKEVERAISKMTARMIHNPELK